MAACTPDFSACDYGTTIEQAGASASYTIADVPSGDYAVAAVQDTNGDGQVGEGDLVGVYTTVVTPPATGIDITLAPATGAESNRLGPQLFKGMERSL